MPESTSTLRIDEETIFHATFKSLVGLIPGFGGFLSEVYSYRSQVKQKRLNRFVEIVTQLLSETGGIIEDDIIELTSEDFGDLFESVIRRVVQNRSEEKSRRFAKILVGSLKTPINNDYSETFLDLISGLSEKQLEVLAAHEKIGDHYELRREIEKLRKMIPSLEQQVAKDFSYHSKGQANSYFSRKQELEQAKNELDNKRKIEKATEEIRNASFYKLIQSEYQFLIQDLYSKALLTDIGVGASDTRAFEIMAITEFGKEFLSFIKTQ